MSLCLALLAASLPTTSIVWAYVCVLFVCVIGREGPVCVHIYIINFSGHMLGGAALLIVRGETRRNNNIILTNEHKHTCQPVVFVMMVPIFTPE